MPQHVWVRFTGLATSNISRDNISNTFCFFAAKAFGYDWDNALDMVEDLYCTKAPGSTAALGAYINNTIKRAARLQAYVIEDSPPRAPVLEREITLPTQASGTQLPAEVAVTCSFQGTRQSGSSQARRRGRIFLGPTVALDGDHPITVAPTMINNVCKQFEAMKAASDASIDYQWRIWSPTDGSSVLVDNGWVDNAWDTQRRRGPRATSRTVWS